MEHFVKPARKPIPCRALFSSTLVLFVSVACTLCAQAQSSPPEASHVPPFESGDRIAFLGDSITSGGSYHEDIRVFWATRFPDVPIHIWNKGIFSDFARGGVKRIERDTLEEKPNKVVINYGMNDSGASWRTNFFGMADPGEPSKLHGHGLMLRVLELPALLAIEKLNL